MSYASGQLVQRQTIRGGNIATLSQPETTQRTTATLNQKQPVRHHYIHLAINNPMQLHSLNQKQPNAATLTQPETTSAATLNQPETTNAATLNQPEPQMVD